MDKGHVVVVVGSGPGVATVASRAARRWALGGCRREVPRQKKACCHSLRRTGLVYVPWASTRPRTRLPRAAGLAGARRRPARRGTFAGAKSGHGTSLREKRMGIIPFSQLAVRRGISSLKPTYQGYSPWRFGGLAPVGGRKPAEGHWVTGAGAVRQAPRFLADWLPLGGLAPGRTGMAGRTDKINRTRLREAPDPIGPCSPRPPSGSRP